MTGRALRGTPVGERGAVISGIGQSDVGRRLNRSPLWLTLDACLEAIADAGLTREDIDGIATYPGKLKLIATGFGEACTAVNQIAHFLNPSAKVMPGHSSNMALFGQKED